jgi:hypothetical protein
LHIVPLDNHLAGSQAQSISLSALPYEAATMVLPNTGQGQAALAATPFPDDRGWRVGWQTASGLAIVDVTSGESPSVTLIGDQPMLAGLDSTGAGSLSLSPDGLFALMTLQPTFSAPLQVRAFNLDFIARRHLIGMLRTVELVREACRIAKLQDGSNALSKGELLLWLGEGISQPCDGSE